MLNSIIRFSVSNKLVVGLCVLLLIVYGSFQLVKLPIDAVPDITNNQVQIITTAPSLGAADIERLITFPIEQANNNIPGLVEIRSFSRFGLSLVTIVFNDNTDVYWARQQVAERLQIVRQQIPPELGSPELGPVTTGLGEIYQYVLQPKPGYEKNYSAMELRTIQDWIVRRQLLSVKGVAEVSSFGGRLKQFEVALDPQQLQAHQLSVNDIFDALQNNNENTGGAYIERGPGVLNIRTEGLLRSIDDIKQVVVKVTGTGAPLLVGDLAEVKEGEATRFGALTLDDKGEVAGAVVMMLKGANSSEIIKNVKSKIADIQTTLPEGLEIQPFLDRTKMVNNAISTVEKNLLEGALIVVFVLVIFLGNIRAGFLVASVIPLSMLFAVILMNWFGVSGNLMSLGALDFGLIVDGAVIIVEAVMHQLTSKGVIANSRLNQTDLDDTVKHSAGRMMNSAVFGQLIILVVYLPIFSLQGIEGKMFKPMAQTVSFALLGAFLLSLTYIPMMSSLILNNKSGRGKKISDRLMDTLSRKFSKSLQFVIKVPKISLVLVGVLLVTAVLILINMGGEFIPTLEEGDFAVETRLLPGSNISTSVEETKKAARILIQRFPEVEKVVTKIGSGEVPTDPMPMEAADMIVVLKDKAVWKTAATFNELAEKMSAAVEEVPGVTFSFQYPVQMRFNELMTGAKQDVVCKIFGEDLDTLSAYAQRLGSIARSINGAEDVYVETATGMPQILVEYNRAVLAQYGMSVSGINRIVNTAFAGQAAGNVYEGERRFDLTVRLLGDKRKSLEDVKDLLVPTPSGVSLPLSHFATVSIKDGPNQIQREEARRRIIVGFNAKGRDVQSIVDDLKQRVESQIDLPVGYFITYGGTFENLQAAKQRLSIAVPVALALILVLLYFAFGSLRQGLLIFSAIPLSAIGGIYALWLRDMPFSISAGIGFIALFGVAVLNGVVLVAEFNRLRKAGSHTLEDVVIQGTCLRLRPVLMTAAVASLGFLPMALSNGSGAEVQRPLATVVIGGLLVATFLTLFLLPQLFLLFEKKSAGKRQIKHTLPILFLFLSPLFKAQSGISIAAATDSALQNNFMVKLAVLQQERIQYMRQTATDLPKTNIGMEYGQINSAFYDNRFSVGQSFNFPTVYARQKQLYQLMQNESALNVQLKRTEIKREVRSIYFSIQINELQKRLLLQSDSFYSVAAEKAKRKLEAGESNALESAGIEAQWLQIKHQLMLISADQNFLIDQFQQLINCKAPYVPENTTNLFELAVSLVDTTLVSQHPQWLLAQAGQLRAKNTIKTERAKLSPDLFIAYNNMSMKGTGADNIVYTGSSRFQSAQIGIGVPLFFGSQKARIHIARSEYVMEQIKASAERRALSLALKTANKNFATAGSLLKQYENSGQKSKTILKEAAINQYSKGELGFFDFVIIYNQALAMDADYYTVLSDYYKAAIQLLYLSNQ